MRYTFLYKEHNFQFESEALGFGQAPMFYDTPLLEIPGSSVPSAKCYSYSCYSRISDIPRCLKII